MPTPRAVQLKKMVQAVKKGDTSTERINFEQFLAIMTNKMEEESSEEEIIQSFRMFEPTAKADGSSTISFGDLQRVASDLGVVRFPSPGRASPVPARARARARASAAAARAAVAPPPTFHTVPQASPLRSVPLPNTCQPSV